MYAKKHRIQVCFNKAAKTYDQAASLQREAADDLFKYLPAHNFKTILDLGCGTGHCARVLSAVLPQAQVLGIDIAPQMTLIAKQKHQGQGQYLCADFDNLPIQNKSIDLVFSNLALQWSLNLEATFAKLKASMKEGAYLIFSTLLTGTLIELKQAWQQIDASKHTNDFLSVGDVKKTLTANNFEIIQSDTHNKKYYYQNVFEVMRSLKAVGANCVIEHGPKYLMQKQCFMNLNKAYPRDQQQLPLSYELGYFVVRKN